MSREYNNKENTIFNTLRNHYSEKEIDTIIDIYVKSGYNESILWTAIDRELYNNRSFEEHLALINAVIDCKCSQVACLMATDSKINKKRTVQDHIKLMHAYFDHDEKNVNFIIASDNNMLDKLTVEEQIEYMDLLKELDYDQKACSIACTLEGLGKNKEEIKEAMKQVASGEDVKAVIKRVVGGEDHDSDKNNSSNLDTNDNNEGINNANQANTTSSNEIPEDNEIDPYNILGVYPNDSAKEVLEAFEQNLNYLFSLDKFDAKKYKDILNSFVKISLDSTNDVSLEDGIKILEKLTTKEEFQEKFSKDFNTINEYKKHLKNYSQKVKEETERQGSLYGIENDKGSKNVSTRNKDYILDTKINKPRYRIAGETDQQYEKYLSDYYNSIDFTKAKKHKIKNRRKNKKHKLLKKILLIATLAVIGVSACFGLRNKNKNKTSNSTTDFVESIDSTNNNQSSNADNFDEELSKEINKILNNSTKKDITNLSTGNLIKLAQGTKYYYNSQRMGPTGKIGNAHTSPDSNYLINSIALVSKKDNHIIGITSDKSITVKEMMNIYDVDKKDCRVACLIGNNGKINKNEALGWVILGKNNFQKTGDINNHRGKVKHK